MLLGKIKIVEFNWYTPKRIFVMILNNFQVNKSFETPIYKQIVSQIIKLIEAFALKDGDRLPTERELAVKLGVARGTIKKAYQELEHMGAIKTMQGCGTFVCGYETHETEVNTATDKLIDKLCSLGFELNEIRPFIEAKVRSRQRKNGGKINIALIDCNIEALEIFKKQLSHFNLNYMSFLLSDFLRLGRFHLIFQEFDLIFTTNTHVNDYTQLFKAFDSKVIRAAVSPDTETLFNISKIKEHDKIGVLVKSERFGRIIANNLKSFGVNLENKSTICEEGLTKAGFDEFIKDKKTLIVPPLYAMGLAGSVYNGLFQFCQNGGTIIPFNYMIEKGSLIYIEEKISSILKGE